MFFSFLFLSWFPSVFVAVFISFWLRVIENTYFFFFLFVWLFSVHLLFFFPPSSSFESALIKLGRAFCNKFIRYFLCICWPDMPCRQPVQPGRVAVEPNNFVLASGCSMVSSVPPVLLCSAMGSFVTGQLETLVNCGQHSYWSALVNCGQSSCWSARGIG